MTRFFRSLRLLVLCGSLVAAPFAARRGAAQPLATQTQPVITNTTSAEVEALNGVVARFAAGVSRNEEAALRALSVRSRQPQPAGKAGADPQTIAPPVDLAAPPAANAFKARTQITHAALNAQGALVRVAFQVTQDEDTISSGRFTAWLTRTPEGGFKVARIWPSLDDAAAALAGAAQEEVAKPASANGNVLALVAEWRGGHWLALRRTLWSGRVYGEPTLATQNQQGTVTALPNATATTAWLRDQMAQITRAHNNASGTAHFFLQRASNQWVGLSAVWQAPSPAHQVSQSSETSIAQARTNLEGQGYLSGLAHRDLARALAQAGLWNEAADEFQVVELLQPGSATNALEDADKQRVNDPQNQARAQATRESGIGLVSQHPNYVINTLLQNWKALNQKPAPGSPLLALRLGLEYSKLAEDEQAKRWLQQALSMVNQGVPAATTTSDAAWTKLLFEHLAERQKLSIFKPRNIIRSALFSVRCNFDDPRTLLALSALESAQHTIYGDFGIPMGSTEVVLWPSQAAFQRYTSQYADAPTSEFVAALTLTKLIDTDSGPMVLNEEINAFSDQRTELFGTIAHEYGHVAVRQLAQGRKVPVWFNEGVATVAEGGYEGYLERVRMARDAGALMPMSEMREWDVDGERAFLAYSQANSMLDYLMEHYGDDVVLRILRAIGGDGANPPVAFETAFQNVTGISSPRLWNDWAREGIR